LITIDEYATDDRLQTRLPFTLPAVF